MMLKTLRLLLLGGSLMAQSFDPTWTHLPTTFRGDTPPKSLWVVRDEFETSQEFEKRSVQNQKSFVFMGLKAQAQYDADKEVFIVKPYRSVVRRMSQREDYELSLENFLGLTFADATNSPVSQDFLCSVPFKLTDAKHFDKRYLAIGWLATLEEKTRSKDGVKLGWTVQGFFIYNILDRKILSKNVSDPKKEIDELKEQIEKLKLTKERDNLKLEVERLSSETKRTALTTLIEKANKQVQDTTGGRDRCYKDGLFNIVNKRGEFFLPSVDGRDTFYSLGEDPTEIVVTISITVFADSIVKQVRDNLSNGAGNFKSAKSWWNVGATKMRFKAKGSSKSFTLELNSALDSWKESVIPPVS